MQLTHFYHCFAAGAWRDPVEEHLSALARVGYDGPFHVGLVGSEEDRTAALEFIASRRRVDRLYPADAGFEQVTLRKLRDHARRHRDGFTFYAHTKGAANPSRLQECWRRSMTCALLGGVHGSGGSALESHLASLAIAYDLVGCHWLTEDAYPHVRVMTAFPMMGGNFWLVRNDYLAALPPLGRERHDAEAWLGEARRTPRVLDLNPGWPGTVPWITKIGWPR
jgi:hypothetical protein